MTKDYATGVSAAVLVTEPLAIADIDVPPGRRPVSAAAIDALMVSMRRIGLRTPITVRPRHEQTGGGRFTLVSGGHRLAAAKGLGWSIIDCFVIYGDDCDAELWEIAENLHRADLTAMERDEQVAKWVKLTEEKRASTADGSPAEAENPPEGVSAQLAPKSRGGRPESGINAASRELGIERTAVQRAVKVANLSPEAKQAARDAGLDDNRSALLDAAKHPEPEQQVQSLLKRRPVDRERIALNTRSRMLREVAAIIVQHIPEDVLPALRANLEGYGLMQVSDAIVKAGKELRR